MTSPNNIDDKDSQIKTFESDLTIENSLYSELSSKFQDKVQLLYVKPKE